MEAGNRQIELRETTELRPVVKLPPTPVFDEQIEAYVALTVGFVCNNEMDFERSKVLGVQGTNLKNDIINSYRPVKQAIDAYKQPILDQEKADLTKVLAALETIDGPAVEWKREQDRIAQAEADRKKAEDLKKKEAEKQKEVDLLKEWGDEEGAKEVAQTPIPPTRSVAVSSGFTYRRGVRTKPKLKFRVDKPDAVKREFCSPDLQRINFKIANFLAYNKKPTEEQIKKLAEEIGGGVLEWE